MLEYKRLEINIGEVDRQIGQITKLNLPPEEKSEILKALAAERKEYRLAQIKIEQAEVLEQ